MGGVRWRWALLACILVVAVPRQAVARESVKDSDATGDGYLDASWKQVEAGPPYSLSLSPTFTSSFQVPNFFI